MCARPQQAEGGGVGICICVSYISYIFILFKLSFMIVEHLSMAAARKGAELAPLCQRGKSPWHGHGREQGEHPENQDPLSCLPSPYLFVETCSYL